MIVFVMEISPVTQRVSQIAGANRTASDRARLLSLAYPERYPALQARQYLLSDLLLSKLLLDEAHGREGDRLGRCQC